jgi:Uma2 family endonuclease
MTPTLEAAPPATEQPDGLYEVINGQKREVPHMGALAGAVASMLISYLNLFAWQHKLGFATSEVLFRLRPDRPQRRPDVAFVSYERWNPPPNLGDDPAALDVVPNLAVEVISPTNDAADLIDKIGEYFQAGVQLVWVIYPRQRLVYVYSSPTQNQILTETDELDGGMALPGFRVRIADLFAVLQKPQ